MSEQEHLTPDAARALLAQERQQRIAACAAEMERVLQQHGCQLVPEIVLLGETTRARVVIVAREA